MKNIQQLFELSNYDSKNITNKGSVIIPKTALDKIEKEGATLEFLQELQAPIFKYRTQITIHGIFPELKNNYLDGYKQLFQNKNLSIGVKWNAVDAAKKDHIYTTVRRYLKSWHLQHNSTDYYIYKQSNTFNTKEQYKELLQQAQDEINHIDKSLFFGNCGVFLNQLIWGGYTLVSYINIGGILAGNIDKVIESICKTDIKTITSTLKEQDEKREQERKEAEAKRQAEINELREKQQPLIEAARELLKQAGYTWTENVPIQTDVLYITIKTDVSTGRFYFHARKYFKEQRQKKFRFLTADSNDLNFEFKDREYNWMQTIKTSTNGYTLPEINKPAEVQATSRQAPDNIKPVPAGLKIEVVQYSEKSIGIFGDTKEIKDALKSIGAKFNPYLNKDGGRAAGWILPETKRTSLNQILN